VIIGLVDGLVGGPPAEPVPGTPLVTLPGVTHTAEVSSTEVPSTEVPLESVAPLGGGGPPSAKAECPSSVVVRVRCGHGNFRPIRVGCDKWSCLVCAERKFWREFQPEIEKALVFASNKKGWTLKHITLTWQADDEGAQPTPGGARRRTLDIQHIVQDLRRGGRFVEYVRVSEAHRSGRIHVHMLAVTPYLEDSELKVKWEKHTRGSSFVADCRAVSLRCPRCWPKGDAGGLSKAERWGRGIVPPPGKGVCGNCGYQPDWNDPLVWQRAARDAAYEAGKYLSKEFREDRELGTRKAVSRSEDWIRLFGGDVEVEKVPCLDCGQVHQVEELGYEAALVKLEPGLVDVLDARCAYYPPGGAPCGCFEGVRWLPSNGGCEGIQGRPGLQSGKSEGPGEPGNFVWGMMPRILLGFSDE